MNRNLVKKVAAKKLQLAAYAKVRVLGEMEIVDHTEVKIQKEFGFAAGLREFAINERVFGGEKTISEPLYGGEHHRVAGTPFGARHYTPTLGHAVRPEN